ncbi:MAG: hypothetical protein QM773_19280 [Hyphomonadaceae bacterium]
MRLRPGIALVVTLLTAAACAPDKTPARPSSAPPTSTSATPSAAATSAEIHAAFLNPGSDALYAAEANTPIAAGDWARVEAAAVKMAEGAKRMQGGSQSEGRADWVRISKLVETAALRAREAARTKDADMLAAADGDFTAQCEDCHNAFRDKPGQGMMSDPGQ